MRRASLIAVLVGAALASTTFAAVTTAADEAAGPAPDICLRLAGAGADESERSAIIAAVEDALAARPVLIPQPVVAAAGSVEAPPTAPAAGAALGAWTDAGDLGSGAPLGDLVATACGADEPASNNSDDGRGAWSASISADFLRAGTKRELAAAPTTPGFSSEIDVESRPDDEVVRTVLTFSGPFGFPNGTCWMDDLVGIDGQGGTRTDTTTGSATSPFGDGVCGRFEEYLAAGGAGAQAIVLLPRAIALASGAEVRLLVDRVDVRSDGIHMAGSLERSEG